MKAAILVVASLLFTLGSPQDARAEPRVVTKAVYIKALPGRYKVVRVGPRAYYVSNGVYYERRGKHYIVVRTPRVRVLSRRVF